MTSTSAQPPEQDQEFRSVLDQAHTLRRAGFHGEAISRLDEAMRSPLQHDEVFAGMALALKARSQVHLMDDAGASLTISLVPALVRRLNPKVNAYCQIVYGLVHRRRAYRSWKAGSPDLDNLHAAIDCFSPRSVIGANAKRRSARQLVPGLSEQLALLQRMSKHAFPGRRVFR
jgi:hypothetical protein